MEFRMHSLIRHGRTLTTIAGIIAIAAMISVSALYAQEVAIGTATATVLAAVTVTATGALTFGDVYQGVPKSVADNEASAAIFTVTGQGGAGVSIFFQLPEYLALSDGSDRMRISFSATDCSVDTTGADDPTSMAGANGWQDVDPRALPSGVLVGSGGTSVYLGGKVTPSVYQSSGSYSGDIILTVSYNGT
jgi:hypothetical protein